MVEKDELNTPVIAVVGFLGAVLTFAIIVLLMVVYYQTSARVDYQKTSILPFTESRNVLAEQQEKLASYGWVNEQERIAHIPIDRAMQLVVADLAAGRPPVKAEDAASPTDTTVPSTEPSATEPSGG